MEQKQTRVTFEDVNSKKVVTILITENPEETDAFDINVDFGEDGIGSHEEGGLYAGLCNDFCEQVLGMFDDTSEIIEVNEKI